MSKKTIPSKIVKKEKEEVSDDENSFGSFGTDATYFPALFCETKTGKIMKWLIWAADDLVYQTNGFVDGKMKEAIGRKISKLKRKNAVSAEEQAIVYAERAWIKQLDKGYMPDKENETAMEMYNKVMKEKALQGNNNTGLTLSSKKEKESSDEEKPKKAVAKKKATSKEPKLPKLVVEKVDKLYTPMKAHKFSDRVKKFVTDKEQKKALIKKADATVKKKGNEYIEDGDDLFHQNYFDATEGFLIQPKLDGWRCVIRLQLKKGVGAPKSIDDFDCVMTTQDNKQYPWFKHIKEEFKTFVCSIQDDDVEGAPYEIALDCEVYADSIIIDGKEVDQKDRFSMIQSACGLARTEPAEFEDQLQIHVFDIISGEQQLDRHYQLQKFFKMYGKGFKEGEKMNNYFKDDRTIIRKVRTYEGKNIEDVKKYHDKFFDKGYEGVMMRDFSGMYSENRSFHLLKYKEFIDTECKVVGATTSEGTEAGCVVWICEWVLNSSAGSEEKKTFTCRQRGTLEKRREIYKKYFKEYGTKLAKGNSNLGYMTIRYQELTDSGLPRFPVGIGFREDMSFES